MASKIQVDKISRNSGTPEFTVPTADGTSGQFIKTDGSGVLSFGSGVALTGSTNNMIPTVTGANALTGEANLTYDGNTLDIKNAGTASSINLYCESSNAHFTKIKSGPHTGATAYTLTLPNKPPTITGQVLSATTGGVASWATVVAGFDDVEAVTATATYTVPTNITKLLVIITGGGGSGSAGIPATANGGGGCSAGTVMARVTVVPTDTITITIGAGGAQTTNAGSTVGNVGGDSTFTHASGSGSFDTITAPGGRAGVLFNTMPAVPVAPTVGASNEGIAIKGGSSNHNDSGAAGFWGCGGAQGIATVTVSAPGEAFGSGGGGGTYTAGLYYGSAGADGVCFIMEFK